LYLASFSAGVVLASISISVMPIYLLFDLSFMNCVMVLETGRYIHAFAMKLSILHMRCLHSVCQDMLNKY
jgi:hypothetical protein